ncbi:MAG TPA: LytTR family DNA-binding domain-containing protein [Chthoniobacterales bacterium]|nr:LytTR family DNA-binding domain-containing protein [Chthoniobacterales bacterium]
MKALIVDDEPWARFEMERLLTPYSWLTIIGQAASASEAIDYLEREDLDAIFLDVQMQDGDGFSVLPTLPTPAPKIIFTTAYSNFAVRAFEVNALDYLLKPIAPERLAKAMRRLMEPAKEPKAETNLKPDDHIFVQDGGSCWFVPVRTIRLLEVNGDYTRVYFGQHAPLIHRTASALEHRLPDNLFFRANRKHLVNLGFVESVTPWFSQTLKLTLKGGEEVEISRRATQALRKKLSL